MVNMGTWGRWLTQAMVACALALFVLAPSLDGLFCREGDIAQAQSTQGAHVVALSAAHDHGKAPARSAGICFFGHCHHPSPFPAGSPAGPEQLAGIGEAQHTVANAALPKSDPKFGLKRPPRNV